MLLTLYELDVTKGTSDTKWGSEKTDKIGFFYNTDV